MDTQEQVKKLEELAKKQEASRQAEKASEEAKALREEATKKAEVMNLKVESEKSELAQLRTMINKLNKGMRKTSPPIPHNLTIQPTASTIELPKVQIEGSVLPQKRRRAGGPSPDTIEVPKTQLEGSVVSDLQEPMENYNKLTIGEVLRILKDPRTSTETKLKIMTYERSYRKRPQIIETATA